MRGRVFIISFFLGLCSYPTSPWSPWPPWPIKWNLAQNEYEDGIDIQRMVYIHFNCTCDYLTHCGKPPLVRYGYVDTLHIEDKYQKRLCYNNDHSMICRRNKTLQTDRNWVVKALKDATNMRMVECLKPLFLDKISNLSIHKRYKRSTFEEADIFLPPTKAAKTAKRTRRTTKAIPYEPELDAPWKNKKFPEEYDETYTGPERGKKPSTVFAAVLLTLVIANMIFVVLLIICLMLYLKVKRAEMMGSRRGGRQFASRARSKHSSRRKSTKNSSGAEGDDRFQRNGEKKTQSQKSLQDQGNKAPDAGTPLSPNEGAPQVDELTGIPLTVKNPTAKLAYQDHLDPPKMQHLPPKAPSRNIPLTAVPADNVPVMPHNDPGFANLENVPGSPAPQNVAKSPKRHKTIPTISPPQNPLTYSVTGAPATVTVPQKIPQNRMKQSVDVPIRQQLRTTSPGVRARNVQSVTLM
ncbi:hypothetical protein Aduo_003158 [Ancylostoma duodenale]